MKLWHRTHQHPMSGKHHSKSAKQKIGNAQRGINNWNWKNGHTKHSSGYILILVGRRLNKKSKYEFEHRLIMEKHLGRKIKFNEEIHHFDGNPSNNRIENLVLLKKSQHRSIHFTKRFCIHGHEFTKENTYIRPDSKTKQCKICAYNRRHFVKQQSDERKNPDEK